MAAQKPLPFDRVRVLVDAGSGFFRRADARRPLPAQRVSPEAAWRLASRNATATSATVADCGSQPPEVPLHPPEYVEGEVDALGRAASLPVDRNMDEVDEAPVSEEESPRNETMATADAMPQAQAQTASTRRVVKAPLSAVTAAAVARAVEDAATMRSVAAMVVETCSGDSKRATGPWEFTLPLRAHGLGESTLNLRLSREQLLLRFACDGPAVRDLLSRQSNSLHKQLSSQLQPPLEVEIELDDV